MLVQFTVVMSMPVLKSAKLCVYTPGPVMSKPRSVGPAGARGVCTADIKAQRRDAAVRQRQRREVHDEGGRPACGQVEHGS